MSVTFGQRSALTRLELASKLYKSNPERYHEDLARISKEVLYEFGVIATSEVKFEDVDESLVEEHLYRLEDWYERCCFE